MCRVAGGENVFGLWVSITNPYGIPNYVKGMSDGIIDTTWRSNLQATASERTVDNCSISYFQLNPDNRPGATVSVLPGQTRMLTDWSW